jgi:hypothetical protein
MAKRRAWRTLDRGRDRRLVAMPGALASAREETAMSRTVELRLPRHVSIALGRLDDEHLAEVQRQLAEAEKLGQGMIIAEHRHMKVVEVAGMTTGRIVAELRLFPVADPLAILAGYQSAPPQGITVLAMIPAGMLAKAAVTVLDAVPATA